MFVFEEHCLEDRENYGCRGEGVNCRNNVLASEQGGRSESGLTGSRQEHEWWCSPWSVEGIELLLCHLHFTTLPRQCSCISGVMLLLGSCPSLLVLDTLRSARAC